MDTSIPSSIGSHSVPLTFGQHLQQKTTLLLIALGVFAVYAHATFRFPLNLPGHHGLEWMAILALSRQLSSYRWAATITAGSAAVASMFPVMGFHNPLVPVTYLVPGLLVDVVFLVFAASRFSMPLMFGVLCGLAFATKPLLHYAAFMTMGIPYGAMKQGLPYVIGMHAVFGFVGGALGAWGARRLFKKP